MHLFLAESSIQLVPDGTLLLHLVLVGLMVFVLNRTLLKPINKVLSDREAEIKRGMSEAKTLSLEREEKIQHYKAALREARGEGYKLLEKERAQALSEKEANVRGAREQVAKKVTDALATTNSQKEQAKRELEVRATELSAKITTQILRSEGRPQ
jgi:F-type H+-transporting ATPase subunit b